MSRKNQSIPARSIFDITRGQYRPPRRAPFADAMAGDPV
jgi:hypothetical protein